MVWPCVPPLALRLRTVRADTPDLVVTVCFIQVVGGT